MKIYLVRHGETEWNVLRRVQGSMDAPLTENGIQQAKNVAKRLAKVDFAAAFASPQMRAYRTAEKIVAEHPTITLQKSLAFGNFPSGIGKVTSWMKCIWRCRINGIATRKRRLCSPRRTEIA